MIPQIIILSLIVVNLVLVAAVDGRPRHDKWSFKTVLGSSIIQLSILYAGDFFDVFFK